MKNLRLFHVLFLLSTSMLAQGQGNQFLKKYAAAYHLMNFGEEVPTASSEKVNLTIDGKWTSIGFPVDDNGVVSKVAVKKSGTWKASEGLIQLSFIENGAVSTTDFNLDDGLFMSSNTWLKKIFVSNPVSLQKYAGKYDWLGDGEEKASELTPVILFTADGKCTRTTPLMDENGVVTKTPKKETGTWKANDGVIQMVFKEDGQDVMTEFQLKDGAFVDRKYNSLKTFVPPPPPGYHLKLYAGTYHMLVDGQAADTKTDKYVLTPDGKATWTMYGTPPTVTKGTWKASDGLIQLNFNPPGDSADKGDGLLSDFQLQDGVFRAEGVVLKKVVVKVATKK